MFLSLVGGHRFYDRLEVKYILDYLRVINQPEHNDALARVINVPSRKIGDTTVKSLFEEAEQSSRTVWTVILEHVQGIKKSNVKMIGPTEEGLSSFVNIILTGRKKASGILSSQLSITDLIEYIIKKTSFEKFLEKSFPEPEHYEARWANVQELINQASEFSGHDLNDFEDDETLPEIDGLQQDDQTNPLSRFLANIALASEVKMDEAAEAKPQVTISTIHAAKGLEWPVVFIPAAYEGSIPHSRAEDSDEERRLLYVAMTRAKALLYLSYPLENSRKENTALSPFLRPKSLKPFLEERGPSFTSSVVQSIAQILNRQCPSKDDLEISRIGLDRHEDDLDLLKGDVEEQDANYSASNVSYRNDLGHRPPKRQRIDKEGLKKPSQETWLPDYSTTMAQSARFSAASVTLSGGFITAGSHFKDLSKEYINSGIEKSEATASRRNQDPGLKDDVVLPKPGKAFKSHTSQSSGGQRIDNFFTKPTPQSSDINCQRDPLSSKRLPLPRTYVDSPAGRGPPGSTLPSANTFGIPPSLASHRPRPGVLPPPLRHHDKEDTIDTRPYIFFSSSPPKPQMPEQIAKRFDTPIVGPPEITAGANAEMVCRNQPAKTMHMTTLNRLNMINAPPPKKTLGMRRDVDGWSNQKWRPFRPPSMSKPP